MLIAVTGSLVAFLCPQGAPGAEAWKALYAQGEAALADQKPAKAEPLFRAALKSAKSANADFSDTAKCQRKLADTLVLRNKQADAQLLYRQLLSSMETKYGKESTELVPLLYKLGSIQESAGDHSAAMVYYRRAVAINEKSWGPYSPQLAESLHKLARSNTKTGNLRDAATNYKQAFDILSKDPSLRASSQLENLTHDYADLIKNLDDSNRDLIKDFDTDILKERIDGSSSDQKSVIPVLAPNAASFPADEQTPNSGDTASEWQKQSATKLSEHRQWQVNEEPMVIHRSFAQPGSPQTLAPAYKVVQTTLFNQDRFENAESNYKRTIAADIQCLGLTHPAVANDMIALAQLYIARKRYGDALPLLKDSLKIYEQAYGSTSMLTLKAKSTLASVEFKSGNKDNATELFKSLLGLDAAVLASDNLETANVLNQLAYHCYQQGKLEDAVKFYSRALSSTEGAAGKHDPLVAACLKDYALVLRGLGKTAEADAAEIRAKNILATSK